jgi:hypothetical protein
MTIKSETVASISTLDLCSTKERHLIEHVVRRFHRPLPEMFPELLEADFEPSPLDFGTPRWHVGGDLGGELVGFTTKHGENPRDYLEYGDGVPNGDDYSDEEILRFIEILTKRIDVAKAAVQKTYDETRRLSDDAAAQEHWWKLKTLWKCAKARMALQRKGIHDDYVKRTNCWGELRAREQDAQPWLTPWMTSDLCGPASVTPEGRTEEWDADLHGMNARSHSGDVAKENPDVTARLKLDAWIRPHSKGPMYVQRKVVQLTATVTRRRK